MDLYHYHRRTLTSPRTFTSCTAHKEGFNLLAGQYAASYLGPYQAGWHGRLAAVEKERKTPWRWWRQQQFFGKRRGLFNAIGSGMNYLFGVATSDQISGLRESVRDLSDKQQRIINQLSQFTFVLNHTYDEIHTNRHQINLLSEKLRPFTATVRRDFGHVLQQVKLLSSRVNFEVLVSQLESISHRFVRSYEAWLHRRENLELGKLSESLLPPQFYVK